MNSVTMHTSSWQYMHEWDIRTCADIGILITCTGIVMIGHDHITLLQINGDAWSYLFSHSWNDLYICS